jgi:hypothetical protein
MEGGVVAPGVTQPGSGGPRRRGPRRRNADQCALSARLRSASLVWRGGLVAREALGSGRKNGGVDGRAPGRDRMCEPAPRDGGLPGCSAAPHAPACGDGHRHRSSPGNHCEPDACSVCRNALEEALPELVRRATSRAAPRAASSPRAILRRGCCSRRCRDTSRRAGSCDAAGCPPPWRRCVEWRRANAHSSRLS